MLRLFVVVVAATRDLSGWRNLPNAHIYFNFSPHKFWCLFQNFEYFSCVCVSFLNWVYFWFTRQILLHLFIANSIFPFLPSLPYEIYYSWACVKRECRLIIHLKGKKRENLCFSFSFWFHPRQPNQTQNWLPFFEMRLRRSSF